MDKIEGQDVRHRLVFGARFIEGVWIKSTYMNFQNAAWSQSTKRVLAEG